MKLPRNNRLSWEDHHILLALITANRSPDPNTQVGSVLVDRKNRIVGMGYNGLPRGIKPELIDWSRSADNPCNTKYPFVVHAEKNAIKNTSGHIVDLDGCVIYSTLFPCNDCAKDIIQAGVKKVIYLENPYKNTWSVQAAEKMFELAEVETIQHEWNNIDTIKELLEKICQLIKPNSQ